MQILTNEKYTVIYLKFSLDLSDLTDLFSKIKFPIKSFSLVDRNLFKLIFNYIYIHI